jgi:hypothetical protein
VAVGIDHQNRTAIAKFEATGGGDHDVVHSPIGQLRFQITQEFGGVLLDALAFGLQAAKTHTDKYVMFRFFHNCNPFISPLTLTLSLRGERGRKEEVVGIGITPDYYSLFVGLHF